MICAACNEPDPVTPGGSLVAPGGSLVATGGSLVAPGGSPGAQSACPSCGQDPLLDGRYRLEAVLGTGSTGTTYRATSTRERLGDPVGPPGGDPTPRALADGVFAVKEIPLRGTSPKARELAEREARVLSELDHPGVPRYREAVVAGTGRGKALWVVQEHVDGVDLHAETQRHRYSEGEVLDVLDELLGILAYLHSRTPPVVHRDVKPKNVMRRSGEDGGIVLVDFGAVRDALKGELGGSTVAGTFGYMAPEQFQGDATPATDLYGVGALAVALLTRKEPHTMLDASQRLRWEKHAVLSPATARLLHELLAAEPGQRPRSADEARARVREAKRALARGAQPVPVTSLELAGPALRFKEPTPAPEFDQGLVLRKGAGVERRATTPGAAGVVAATVVALTLGGLVVMGLVAAIAAAGLFVMSPVMPPPSTPPGGPQILLPSPDVYADAVRADPVVEGCLERFGRAQPDWPGAVVLFDARGSPSTPEWSFEGPIDEATSRCLVGALAAHPSPPIAPGIGIYSFTVAVPR